MNREILFRGKQIDNDEWVEGYFLQLYRSERAFIVPKLFVQRGTLRMSGETPPKIIPIEVIPESVSQFTGLVDKNGKRIFERDIISATALDTGEEQRAVVCFGNFIDENNNDEYIGFFIEFDGIKTTIIQLSMEECKNRIEVIGNIYDNPELLEVEND